RDTKLLLGLRPEHLVDAQSNQSAAFQPFDATPDVIEPMGMETFVYFPLAGAQLCGRINPGIDAQAGAPLRLAVDLNHMHLLNEATGAVL
ncbi:MAG: sugar ABC transporter ATP-binding protein, partial [Rhizobiales bacterium]|nr:sugar ABC transporter ATP-binding protein [Hyphomicrobiales bacterium]